MDVGAGEVIVSKDAEDDVTVLLQSAIPQWTGRIARIEPVSGGMTNRNFCAWVDEQLFFVRIGGLTTERLGINRDVEFAAAELAGRLGIAPPVLFYSADRGILVTRYICGRALTSEELGSPAVLREAIELLRRAHAQTPSVWPFSVFATIEQYWRTVQRLAPELLRTYQSIKSFVREVQVLVPNEPLGLCHNDLLAANFVQESDTHRLWLVDWEYAGLGTLYFDLGNFASNQKLTPEREVLLAQLYFDTADLSEHVSLIRLLRIMSDVREALWGAMQQLLSPLAFDFAQYATVHWERVERALSEPEMWLDFERLKRARKT